MHYFQQASAVFRFIFIRTTSVLSFDVEKSIGNLQSFTMVLILEYEKRFPWQNKAFPIILLRC